MKPARLLCPLLPLLCACAAARPTPPAASGASAGSALPAPSASAPPAAAATASPDELKFLRDVIETRGFSLGKPTEAQLVPNGSQVIFLRAEPRSPRNRLMAFEVANGAVRELISPEQVLHGAAEKVSPEEKARQERMRVTAGGFTSFQIARDGRSLLVSLAGGVYVVDLATRQVSQVAAPDAKGRFPFDAHLSPDGSSVAFVRANELWVAPSRGGAARQLTRGGTATLLHAQAEFVAQEEMGRFTGHWWSPDSKSLAYEVADTSGVEELRLVDPANPFEGAEPQAYPRPGKANAKVTLGVIGATGGKTRFVEWDQARYPYLTRVVWSHGAPLTLEVQSRDQKDVALLAADPRSGKTRELVHEHDDAWVDLAGPGYAWLEDGSAFLWSTERGGAWQLELRRPDGSLQRTLTPPELGLQHLLHLDAAGRSAFVTAGDPVAQQIFEIPLAGGAPTPVTKGPRSHSATFARESPARILSSWGDGKPAVAEVLRADGSSAGPLPSIAETPPFQPHVDVAKVGAQGFWSALVRPRNFEAGKRYPVLVTVYGGPGVTTVSDRIEPYVVLQWIADHGFIVAQIDGRGTPGRGRAWERAMLHRFSELPLEDQVAGLQALAAREPAMDLSRVGVWGASFGGYMAALSVLRRPDVYGAGVAVAAPSDWLDYDTHYTERYLGVPSDKDPASREIYAANGLLRYAPSLTRPLLIVHGTADDNVHFDQSLKLADALFRAGKPFEFLPLAGQTHVPRQPALQVRYYQLIFDFLHRSLEKPR